MIIIGMAALVFCICVGVGLYLASQSSSPAPAPDSPAPAPAATDPRASVWASGQSIQSAPLDTQTTAPFATPPTGYSGTPTYSMSLDINIAQTATGWRNIFSHSPATNDGIVANARKPSLWVTGGPGQGNPPNRMHIIHQTGTNDNTNIVTTFAATPGTYFNLTWVVSGGVLKAYINGVLDTSGTISGAFTWPSPDQPWTWMNPTGATGKLGSITVANVYWWNSALTDAQVAQLKIPTSPTPGVATTSYYMPEPFDDSKDAADY